MHWEEFSLQIKPDFCLDLERNILHRNDDVSITELLKEVLHCLTFLNSCPTCLHTFAISIYKCAFILDILRNKYCLPLILPKRPEWSLDSSACKHIYVIVTILCKGANTEIKTMTRQHYENLPNWLLSYPKHCFICISDSCKTQSRRKNAGIARRFVRISSFQAMKAKCPKYAGAVTADFAVSWGQDKTPPIYLPAQVILQFCAMCIPS